ncbi:MAG: hypothetical protein NZ988_01430 [Thaumarchaeota archaeon]|nr:hypothetical protein [Candidatus Calditenuaceae archaeon]MDW8186696.1 hypothetical protein [Nitrososphaerota archaeon]
MVILYGYPDPKYLNLYKLGRAIHLDPQVREKFKLDREAVMNEFKLSEEEKELVRSADPVKLFKAGVSPYTIFFICWEGYGFMQKPIEEQMMYKRIKETQL